MMPTVWVVIYNDKEDDTSGLTLVASSLEVAQRATAEYCGEESLTWERRNSIFDSQDYLVATYGGTEYHVYEEDVEQ